MNALDIPTSVIAHSRFFDHLVEMIPARFYHEEEAPAKLRYVPKEDRSSPLWYCTCECEGTHRVAVGRQLSLMAF